MESSYIEDTPEDKPERQKPGPKKGQAKRVDKNLDELVTRLHNLEQLVVRMAHQSGTSHAIIMGSGLTPFNPQRKDMNKFKVG